jgi:magnesium chelatase family protein
MFIKISSVANSGLDSIGVEVEVNVFQKGMPAFEIVGLPAKAVSESKERVRAAIKNSKVKFPNRKIIINLAPADVPKEGSCYDLPIAIGILSTILGFKIPQNSLFFGELSLDGSLRHTKGALLLALFAKENNFKNIFLPADSANEAAVVKGINVYPVNNLLQLTNFLFGKEKIETAKHIKKTEKIFQEFDMNEIIGQESAKRALEIAAAGGHNIFMVGGPGSGKTMLSRALPGILPLLDEEESLEVTKIYSASGNIPPGGSLITTRPFRAPHHTISSVGLTGGGTLPKPGEITLAHRGVLFLDELNEFQRSSLEAMRQPMEDGYVSIVRSKERVLYPSKYMLVASANPCPCGYLNHEIKNCLCSEREVERYKKKVSGPLLDRIDMYIDVPDVETEKLSLTSKERENIESSKEIRKRVEKVREIQKERFKNENILTNSEMKNKHIGKYSFLNKDAENLLISASSKFSFSARSYFKVLKLSRTIADIDGKENIETSHIAEALQYKIQESKPSL